MERLHCKNCGKYSGFSRNWTFWSVIGFTIVTLVLSSLTCGFFLLFLPILISMMPKRCTNCGADTKGNIEE